MGKVMAVLKQVRRAASAVIEVVSLAGFFYYSYHGMQIVGQAETTSSGVQVLWMAILMLAIAGGDALLDKIIEAKFGK